MSVFILDLHHNDRPTARDLIASENRHNRVVPVLAPFAIEVSIPAKLNILSRKPTWERPLVRFAIDIRTRSGDHIKTVLVSEIKKCLQGFEVESASFGLVDKPRDIDVDEIKAIFPHPFKVGFPFRGGYSEVMHGAANQDDIFASNRKGLPIPVDGLLGRALWQGGCQN